MIATAAAVAFIVISCKGKLSEAEKIDLASTPLQTVDDMFFVQSENGVLKIRVEAPVMERYDSDTLSYDLFPKGIAVFGYAADGSLETTITARNARHDKVKGRDDERWSAFGNVVVKNVIKQETMESDTIHWDRGKHEIFTDCYVKMYSPSGFMQGYGMRSDEMARNSIIMQPFNSYGVVVQDSTEVLIDSANFIGPILKKP